MRQGLIAWAVAAALVIADTGQAWGQFRAGFLPPPGRGVVRGGGLGFVVPGRRVLLSGFVGGWGYRYWGWNGWGGWGCPTVWGYPGVWGGAPWNGVLVWGNVPGWGLLAFGGGGWWYPPITTWTPLGWVPGFLPPGWGVGPGWNLGPWGIWWPLAANVPAFGDAGLFDPAVPLLAGPNRAEALARLPLAPLANPALPDVPPQRPFPQAPQALLPDRENRLAPPAPAEPLGDFLVISPRPVHDRKQRDSALAHNPPRPRPMDDATNQAVAQPFGQQLVIMPQAGVKEGGFQQPPPPGAGKAEAGPLMPVAAGPLFRADPFATRPRLVREVVHADAKQEARRLVERGREAFRTEQYGRAARLFAAAAAHDQTWPLARLLQLQAELAAGRY
ncbi:MAG: hypothetical protein NZ703_09820, partial [Gemmataceae bacterium]|nr:hypothetical protein [Gemmataceae bacterium]